MKLLSIAIPGSNPQAHPAHAVNPLWPGGDQVETPIADDGSTDDTARMADACERKFPGIVRALHKESDGHGDTVMTGLKYATGLYFKVVGSDDWVDAEAYPKVLGTLANLSTADRRVDLLISNHIYDKVGVKNTHFVRRANAMPENKALSWRDIKRFRIGEYVLMHSAIYRTELLRACGLTLPSTPSMLPQSDNRNHKAHLPKGIDTDVAF